MLGQYWVPKREKLVKALYAEFMAQAVEYGYDIVIDNMNLSTKTVDEIKQYVEFVNSESKYHYTIEFKDFWTPVEECIRRDAARPNPIGEAVIKQTWKQYRNFIVNENIKAMKERTAVQDNKLPYAIICDMDATLCLNTSGRPFYGKGAAEQMLDDEPISDMLDLVRNYCDNYPAKLIILTGREDTTETRKATEEWLDNHWLHPDMVLMRPARDFSKGPDCKKKLYEEHIKGKYYVPFVFEDSSKCVEMWRELGLLCLQPNEGKF